MALVIILCMFFYNISQTNSLLFCLNHTHNVITVLYKMISILLCLKDYHNSNIVEISLICGLISM